MREVGESEKSSFDGLRCAQNLTQDLRKEKKLEQPKVDVFIAKVST